MIKTLLSQLHLPLCYELWAKILTFCSKFCCCFLNRILNSNFRKNKFSCRRNLKKNKNDLNCECVSHRQLPSMSPLD